jgi:hypothetical protein
MAEETTTNNEVDSFVASQVDVAEEDYPITSKAKETQNGSGKRLQGMVELPAVGRSNNRGNRQAAATISPPPLVKVNNKPAGTQHQVTVKTKLNKFVKERSPPSHLQHRQEQ